MIRLLKEQDINIVCDIVNDNWKSVYAGYINNELLTDAACNDRKKRMKADFLSSRLQNYVFEYQQNVIALLSIGETADQDKLGAYELWRIYLLKSFQNQGIGTDLLNFAEEQARKEGYHEMIIWAFKGNSNGISFYEKNGYKKDKEEYMEEPYLTYGIRFIKKLTANDTALK